MAKKGGDNNMTDFFQQEDKGADAPSTLKIGEKEYTQEQIEQAVSKANQVEQLESQYNTKLDRVWPEYGKQSNKLRDLESELEALKQQATKQPDINALPEDQIKEARAAAKKIGIVTDEDFGGLMAKHFDSYYEQRKSADKMIEDGQRLEREITGVDGRPKFVLESVLQHMKDQQLPASYGLDKAYRDMHEPQLDKWRADELKKNKAQPFITQDSQAQGGREPSPIKATDANIYDLVSEGIQGL